MPLPLSHEMKMLDERKEGGWKDPLDREISLLRGEKCPRLKDKGQDEG